MTAQMTNFKILFISICIDLSQCMVLDLTYLGFQYICSDRGKTKAAETTGQGKELGQHSSICKLPLKEVNDTNFLQIPTS